MGLLRAVARPMLSSIFITGGFAALNDPAGHAPIAKQVTDPLQEAAGDVAPAAADASTEQLVQLNGIAQIIGGMLLAVGRLPRLSALLLAGSLIPTTMAAHRFWDEPDAAARSQQQVHFFKNLSLLGGLLIATMDREGRPSLTWRAGHAVDHAKLAAERGTEIAKLKTQLAASETARSAAPDVADHLRTRKDLAAARVKAATSVDAGEHLKARKDLAKKQLTPDIADAKKLVDAVRSDDD